MPYFQIFLKVFFIALLISPNESSNASLRTENSIDIQTLSSVNTEHLISTATADVIREFFITNDIKFDVIIYGETSRHIDGVINGVMRQVSKDTVPITIEHIKDFKRWNHEMNQSAVIFVKTKENLHQLHARSMSPNNSVIKLRNLEPKPFKFLVYVEKIRTLKQLNDTASKKNNYFAPFPADLRFFELFITSDKLTINLTARVLFSEDHCNAFALKVLNKFDKKSQQWTARLENFNPFSNFHGCLLSFATKINNFFYVKNQLSIKDQFSRSVITSAETEFGGLIAEVLSIMAHKCNFSFLFTVSENVVNSKGPRLLGTKNFNTLLSRLIIIESAHPWRNILSEHYTMPISTLEHYYLVSMNDLYTNYEKLLFPFDVATWSLLLFTFGLTFGTIFGLRFCPQWIRTMIIGKG
jgi:uncharacterized protein (UPF0218 family)